MLAICGNLTGCATNSRQPMASVDIDHFQVDCKNKQQQIRLLQSMRTTADDRLVAGISNTLQPWTVVTNPNKYYERQQIQTGRTNWLINQTLREIAIQC
jgi:hypothetical protein